MATPDQHRLTQWWKTEPFLHPQKQTTERCCDAIVAIELLMADGLLARPQVYFEPGCCLGRNLRLMQERYEGHPYGLEVHPELVQAVEQQVPGVVMIQSNIFDVDTWGPRFSDRMFDLTLTRSFLFYLPAGPDKHRVVQELKRISRFLLVMEPTALKTPEDRGNYICSWERWQDYGLTHYPKANAGGVGAYYWHE